METMNTICVFEPQRYAILFIIPMAPIDEMFIAHEAAGSGSDGDFDRYGSVVGTAFSDVDRDAGNLSRKA